MTDRATSSQMPADGALRELLWIHNIIRQDLATVRRLADEAVEGAAPDAIEAEIYSLEISGPLWKLRVNCIQHCRLVHHHHSLEDHSLFRAMRKVDANLEPAVAILEADHLRIADQLDVIRLQVRVLGESDTHENREELAAALDALANDLLRHLSYEEESLGPTLAGMSFADLLALAAPG